MKHLYDLHIHSGLSPCANDDMTPANIIAAASLKGLEIIAISDHNSIKNVKLTIEIGKLLDILVVPAIELQTNEDIHFLCLFETFCDLEDFYNSITFTSLENKSEVFGNQFIYDEDDNILEEKTLLATSAKISERELIKLATDHNGITIPAHIDRDCCGILAVLGDIPKGYTSLELSGKNAQLIAQYSDNYNLIFNSDAHTLQDIGKTMGSIELQSLSIKSLLDFLRSKK
ncbi:MAG TPA: PHP domain-containing protein [Clostridia bacterium]|nr:PHP domain-containing protein [Clostridia bacterium]